jgi:hypothetical protein
MVLLDLSVATVAKKLFGNTGRIRHRPYDSFGKTRFAASI